MGDELLSPQMVRARDANEIRSELQQTTPGANRVRSIKDRFQRARKARDKFEKPWKRYYQLWAGDHWSGIPLQDWQSRPSVNFIFSTTETIVATMTDQSPQIVVFPRSDKMDDLVVADILQKLVAYAWERSNGNAALENVVRDMVLYGTGIMKVAWNQELDNVELQPARIDQVYVDPAATDFRDAWYVFHVYTMSMNSVVSFWPDKAEQVRTGAEKNIGQFKRDVWESPSVPGRGGHPFSGTTTITDSGHSTRLIEGSGTSGTEPDDMADQEVQVIEYWEKNPKTGKLSVSFIAGDVLVEEISEPLGARITRFPFVRFANHPVTGEFYCVGETQVLEPLQLSINKRRQQIIDNLKILGNPPILADKEAGLEEDVILNAPGEVISVTGGTRVQWLNPPAMPSGLFELQQFEKQEIEAVSGVFDVVQGKRPTGIEAASAITALQESAQTRIRRKTRRMEGALEEIGALIVLLIQQNYTDERIFNLVMEDGNVETLQINKTIPEEVGIPIAEGAEEPAPGAVDDLMADRTQLLAISKAMDITKGEFYVQVKAGSTLPISKSARLNEAILLFDRQIVDSNEVLTAINHPRKREILDRLGAGPAGAEDVLSQIAGMGAQQAAGGLPTQQAPVPQGEIPPSPQF